MYSAVKKYSDWDTCLCRREWKDTLCDCTTDVCQCNFCSDPRNHSDKRCSYSLSLFHKQGVKILFETLKAYMEKKYKSAIPLNFEKDIFITFLVDKSTGDCVFIDEFSSGHERRIPLEDLVGWILSYDMIIDNQIKIGQDSFYISDFYYFLVYQNREEILQLQENLKIFRRKLVKLLNSLLVYLRPKDDDFITVTRKVRNERPSNMTNLVLKYLGNFSKGYE